MNASVEKQRDATPPEPFRVILIGPAEARRQGMAQALASHHVVVAKEFSAYPTFEELVSLTGLVCDALIIDVESAPELAVLLIEKICRRNSVLTVMAYATREEPQFVLRCMRAGAREWLSEPVSPKLLAEAFTRVLERRQDADPKAPAGKLFIFMGAKGGSGVTTLATNFSIMLRKESEKPVVLVDLNLQLGDVSVLMGLKPAFSIVDALRNGDRLDADLISTLLVNHSSGVSVLASSEDYDPKLSVEESSIGRLIWILRDQFPYVVLDAGSSFGQAAQAFVDTADVVYVVSQADLTALRNCRILTSALNHSGLERTQLVLNRFDPRHLDVPEESIVKALGVPLRWKVPNHYPSVHGAQTSGVPLALGNSPLSPVLHHMARTACGKGRPQVTQNRRFGLLRFLGSNSGGSNGAFGVRAS